MRLIIFATVGLVSIFSNYVYSQNVGIGTSSPVARLHVADSNVVFTRVFPNNSLPGSVPISGAGTRLMWYPDKSAFRVGTVDGPQWDKDSIGTYSFGSGANSKAKGAFSTAMGGNTEAIGQSSTAIGSYNIAYGFASVALGSYNLANGNTSFAMGSSSQAYGNTSFAMGNLSQAFGDYSTAIGLNVMSKAASSISVGTLNDIMDNPNPAIPNPSDRLFQIGNGNFASSRSNALTILRNGRVGIGTVNPQQILEVNGNVRQRAYSQSFTINPNVGHIFTWTHNFGYQPIIMISLDQTNGGYCDYVSFSYAHNNTNQLTIYLVNHNPGNQAVGTANWIVVY